MCQPFLLMISSIFSIKNITPGMMVRNHLDDQAMSKLLMKSTHNKKVLEAHKKVLEAHKIVLEAHKIVLEAHKIVLEAHTSFRFSSNV